MVVSKFFLILIFLFFLSFPLLGDSNDTYNDISTWFGVDPNAGQNSFLILLTPPGGKYEGLASTYTAMALDGGYLEANPASGALLPQRELAFTHNDWIADSALETAYYTFRPKQLQNMGLGFSMKFFHVPFTAYNAWGERNVDGGSRSNAAGWYIESIGTANISYNFFNDYYFSGLAVGASIKVGYRGVSATLEAGQNSVALMGDIGLMTRFNLLKGYLSQEKNFSVGVAVQNLGSEFIEEPDPLPSLLRAGFVYKPLSFLSIAADLHIPFNLDGSTSELPYGSLGFDVVAASFLSFHGGAMLKAGKPRFALGVNINFKDFALISNYTFDLATQFSFLDRVSMGIKFNLGAPSILLIQKKVETYYLEGLQYYAEGELEQAANKWEMCLSLDPKFNPAKEMLSTVQRTIELRELTRKLLEL